MKTTNGVIILTFLCLLVIPSVLSDGGIIVYDKDMWGMFEEEQQFAAINHKNGFQNMILTVDTEKELEGDKVVWIFPVPALPEKTIINIVKSFPTLFGYDIEERVDRSIADTFSMIRATQIYTFPLLMFKGTAFKGAEALSAGVTVHETIEKYGLITELISTINSQSFNNYLASKELEIPQNFKVILDDYIGQQYSFVISWISDIESYKKEQPVSYVINLLNKNKLAEARNFWKTISDGNLKQKHIYEFIDETLNDKRLSLEKIKNSISRFTARTGSGNKLGVFIGFPAEKLYYPLKPTSVYGSKRVPVVIYVMDYVEPELYQNIQSDTSVNYFFQRYYSVPEELRDFFYGQEKIQDLKYTKIKVNPPSKFLTQDLWMTISTPAKIKTIDFIERNTFLWGLIVFIFSSCPASLISALVIFRKDFPSKIKFLGWGLLNFLTLIGFMIASYLFKIDKKFTENKELELPSTERKRSKTITLIAFLSPILICGIIGLYITIKEIIMSSRFYSHQLDALGASVLIGAIIGLFIAPFVWAYFSKKKILKFTILFSVLFLILTIIFQLILTIFV